MFVNYPEVFKEKMVLRMSGPDGLSATALSEEVGVAQSSLSRWLREASGNGSAAKKMQGKAKKTTGNRRPEEWTAEEKLEAVLEASSLSDEELGAYLRREGLHSTHLEQWRHRVREAALEALQSKRLRKKASVEAKRVKKLERELRRKEKALAETAALLVLKKKAAAIWGDEDDSTEPRNEK